MLFDDSSVRYWLFFFYLHLKYLIKRRWLYCSQQWFGTGVFINSILLWKEGSKFAIFVIRDVFRSNFRRDKMCKKPFRIKQFFSSEALQLFIQTSTTERETSVSVCFLVILNFCSSRHNTLILLNLIFKEKWKHLPCNLSWVYPAARSMIVLSFTHFFWVFAASHS